MSEQQQLEKMRLEILGNVSDSTKDSVFRLKLGDAKVVALDTLYPYDLTKTELDITNIRLANWQTRCAIELYRKIGTTNVSSYSENGMSVSYLTSLVSDSLMRELIPKAGAIK